MKARTRQPQGAVRVDWSNPLTLALRDAIHFAGPPKSILTSSIVTTNSNAGIVATEQGLAQRFSASGQLRFSSVEEHQLIGDMTAAVLAKQAADTGYLVSKMTSNGAADSPFYFLLIGGSPYWGRANTTHRQWQTATTAANGYSLFSISAPAAMESTPAFYINGVACATPTVADGGGTGAAYPSSTGLIIGARDDGTVLNATSDIALVCLWNRQLSAEEHSRLARNPWQIFAPNPQWLYTGMGSGSWTPLEVTG